MDALKAERIGERWVLGWTLKLGVLVLLLGAVGWAASGAQPEILQPESYNTSQRGVLSSATSELDNLLRDPSLGSQMRLGERAWTSQEFSAFTAGALGQAGYEAVIVSAQWSNERHVWVLVGIGVGDATAWVPVEVTPAPGAVQNSLGHIAWGSAGRYAEPYLQYDLLLDLPPNLAPVAAIRPPTTIPFRGEIQSFLAIQSRDPDGEIILYIWEAEGDRRPTMTKIWSYDHIFEQGGFHTVMLTVVDNRGVRASATITIDIYIEQPEREEDCGCGG